MDNLPIGVQDFAKLIKEGRIYVDKTEYLYNLINNGNVYFLSRPRRFGKSLMISILNYLFQGEKELFKGLWIEDKWNWDDRYPVIRMDFSEIEFESSNELRKKISDMLGNTADMYDVGLKSASYEQKFKELIVILKQKYNKNVVILIDEYDKPILDHIIEKGLANEIRDVLRGFYSVIKASDEHIRFVMLTGITRFSKVSIFSGLNNLNDITMDNKYSTMLGYTQEELEHYFNGYIDGLAEKMRKSKEDVLSEIKKWYNGYKFSDEAERVYNPFSTMLLFDKRRFESHWFETGNPKFLLDVINEEGFFLPEIDNVVLSVEELGNFDIDHLSVRPLLYQTGYLTIDYVEYIDEIGETLYHLGFPNMEVRKSFNHALVWYLTDEAQAAQKSKDLALSLVREDMEGFERQLKALFASLPYNSYVKNNIAHFEGYYINVLFSYLDGMGIFAKVEEVTNKGRVDLTIEFKSKIFIIEVKVGEGSALEQIKEKRYWEKYQDRGKEIVLVGIIFDENERNISKVEWEKV